MKKFMIAAALLGAMAAAQAHADPLDDQLKNRDIMIAAVALLVTVPDKCMLDHRQPSGDEIARFVVSYGHKGDDYFLGDVKRKMRENDEFAKKDFPDKAKVLELVCGWALIMSMKVSEANADKKAIEDNNAKEKQLLEEQRQAEVRRRAGQPLQLCELVGDCKK